MIKIYLKKKKVIINIVKICKNEEDIFHKINKGIFFDELQDSVTFGFKAFKKIKSKKNNNDEEIYYECIFN